MARFHLSVSPSYTGGNVRSRFPAATSIASGSRFTFSRLLAIAIIGGAAFGASIGYAMARDMAVFELRLENNGNMYVVDSGMTGDDCLNAIDEVSAYIDESGAKVAVPADAPFYCVSM